MEQQQRKKQFILPIIVLLVAIIFGAFYYASHMRDYQSSQKQETSNSRLDAMPAGTTDRYGAEVLQVGGVGSQMTQETAYLLTEQGYLKPSEDWVQVSLNDPADIMDVSCREGYAVTFCMVNDKKAEADKIFGCRGMPLLNKMQNVVKIECSKK